MKNFAYRQRSVAVNLTIVLGLLGHASSAISAGSVAEIPVFVAEQGDVKGQLTPGQNIIAGVINLVSTESGLNLVVRAYPWRRAQMMAKNGEGLLFGAAETPERANFFSFTRPLYSVNQWLVTAAQRPIDFKRWEDLRGKVISIPSGGRYGAEFEEQRDKTFIVEENAVTITGRFKMLNSGRVDALLLDSSRTAPQLEARVNCAYAELGKWAVVAKPANAEAVLIAVPKASPLNAYLPVLNDAIERLSKTRSIQKYLEKRAADPTC